MDAVSVLFFFLLREISHISQLALWVKALFFLLVVVFLSSPDLVHQHQIKLLYPSITKKYLVYKI